MESEACQSESENNKSLIKNDIISMKSESGQPEPENGR